MKRTSTKPAAQGRASTALLRSLGTLLAGIALGLSNVQAATVFFEDFENYDTGSNLLGQGGWTGTLAPVLVTDRVFSGSTGSRVLDGRTVGHLGSNYGIALHPFTAPMEPYTLSFDAYGDNTYNTWGGLSSMSEGSATHVATGVFWVLSATANWHLLTRDAGVVVHDYVFGGGGGPCQMSITIDPVNLQVWGSNDSCWPALSTPSFAVSHQFVDAITGVNFGIDYRNLPPRTPGLQIDNVLVATVSAVPESGTRGLLLAGAAMLLAYQRWHRQPQRRL